jgi:hypothetical protein
MRGLWIVLAACAAFGQTRDAFTGTWRLNVERSSFVVPTERYAAGVRTYSPTAKGTRVSWTLTDGAGKSQAGHYAVECKNGHCISDGVYWKVHNEHSVEGEAFVQGVLDRRFTRTVSPDGKILTITFYLPGKSEPSSIQVWERSGK